MESARVLLKMTIMQVLSFSALTYYTVRSLKITFDWLYQPLATLAWLGAGVLAFFYSATLFEVGGNRRLKFLVSDVLHYIGVLALRAVAPSLAELRR